MQREFVPDWGIEIPPPSLTNFSTELEEKKEEEEVRME